MDTMKRPRCIKRAGFWTRKFIEFCKRTDLHGYKYIVMGELHVVERCCWALAVVVSLACAVSFVLTAYNWYARNPIVTVIESTHGAIWDVPFPAVTICDLNHVSLRRARAFSESVRLPHNMTPGTVLAALKYAPLLYSRYQPTDEQKALLYDLQSVLDLNQITIPNMFKTVGPDSCTDLVQRCMWKNTLYRCEFLFHRILSRHTLCCTFNYFATNLTVVKGPTISPVPRRVASCGYQTALSVLVNTQLDDYFSSEVSSYGALVFVDNAYNYPDYNSPSRLINPRTEVMMALTPESTYATSGVSKFDISMRQCLYSDEIKIGKFVSYSYHNCIAYRAVMKVWSMCACLPYYSTVFVDIRHESNRTCDFSDLDCILSASSSAYTRKDKEENDILPTCQPDCAHFDYPLEVAVGLLTSSVPTNHLPFFKDIEINNQSLVSVFFNDLVSTRYRRDVYLNWQNLLASFGGLMSLMLGFTLIAGFDLVIFFSLHLLNFNVSGKKQKTLNDKSRVQPEVAVINVVANKKQLEVNEHNKVGFW